MNIIKKTAIVCTLCGLTATSVAAQDNAAPQFMRSSIYTFLIKSDAQNAKLDEEVVDGNLITGMIKAKSNAKKSANDKTGLSRSQAAMQAFLEVPIPDQFNDHNLNTRIIDYDKLVAGISADELSQAKEAIEGKKKGGGGFMKGLGKKALSAAADGAGSSLIPIDEVGDNIPGVIAKYFSSENIPSNLMAKWFNYGVDPKKKWSDGVIVDRALYNASAEEKEMAKKQAGGDALLLGKMYDLIGNTFVLGVNLRYRSNAAIMAEAQAIADAVASQAGAIGMIASQAAGAAASAALGDGYSVQAVTYLYQLEWTDETQGKFYDQIYSKNASLEDLIASGICTLKPIGKEKARASVRQGITNSRPLSELVKVAVARAIDESITKLQSKFEPFRTVVPISSVGEDGTIYAKIGTKEGCSKDDEYDILEPNEDAKTHRISYKSVGQVKVIDKQIWENRYGIIEDAANMSADEAKKENVNLEAVNLGATAFKGGKKGKDYSGYLLRLKKKK